MIRLAAAMALALHPAPGPGGERPDAAGAVVLAERLERLLERFRQAPDGKRERAMALHASLVEGRPLDRLPEPVEMAELSRVLSGDGRGDELAAFADALDLRVVPGAFDAVTDGERGEPLVVGVHQLARIPLEVDEVVLRLLWIAPDGEETLARSEPCAVPSFGRGFPMYVRAPQSEPGLWMLVPEVVAGDRVRRGVRVRVECVPGLVPRLDRLEAAASEEGGPADAVDPVGRALLHGLRLLAGRGVRPVGGTSAAERLGWLEAGGLLGTASPRAFPGAAPAPVLELPAWSYRSPSGSDSGTAVCVVLSPAGVPAEGLFHGALGEAWRRLADELGCELVSVELGADDGERFLGLLRALERRFDRVLAVARGDATTFLHLAGLGRDLPLDGVVLCSSASRPGPALAGIPAITIGSSWPSGDGAADGSSGPTGATRPAAIWAELDLPARAAPWLAERLADAAPVPDPQKRRAPR